MNRLLISAAMLALCGCMWRTNAPAVATTTEVMVFFDAEDYTSDRPNDALRDLCNLFHDEGFVVHIALAGYLAHEIERYGRMDVVEAMRPHLIGTQSMYHSLHPNIMEMSDGADYAAAYARVYKQEKEAIELIHRVTGRRPFFAVPPGASKSYVAMDVYSDLGIKFYCDTVCARDEAGGDWFQGMRQFPYSNTFWIEALIPGQEGGIAGGKDDVLGINWTKALNELASRPRQIIFLHPCMAVNAEFWDSVNFMKGNFCEFGKWNVPRRRSAADTELYYARIRELLRRIKADGRFALTTLSEKAATERHRSAIKRNDMSGFGALRCTGVYSVADVFQAAVAFLRDDSLREFRPGRTYGFLEKPYAIDRSVALKTIDLRESAGRIDLSRHIPASIDVGGTRIGPGDFLVAALKALNGGPAPSKCPESVTISPSDPLADLDQFPRLRDFHPAGTWVFWPEYKDEFTSDRLRWQLWTWRRE